VESDSPTLLFRHSNLNLQEPDGKELQAGRDRSVSGQYCVVGPRGVDTGAERTVVKGEPFPPTPGPGLDGKPDTTKTN